MKEGKTINEPSTPTKEEYIFDGWYYNDKKFDFSTKVTKDMTLEARWQTEENGDLKDAKLIWKSNDEKIATVDSEGKIKALKEGKVTVTTAAGGKTATIEIEIL